MTLDWVRIREHVLVSGLVLLSWSWVVAPLLQRLRGKQARTPAAMRAIIDAVRAQAGAAAAGHAGVISGSWGHVYEAPPESMDMSKVPEGQVSTSPNGFLHVHSLCNCMQSSSWICMFTYAAGVFSWHVRALYYEGNFLYHVHTTI